ncbi:hypothetical protein WDW86_18870 [Bdellovibrionota bacterium FG-2]
MTAEALSDPSKQVSLTCPTSPQLFDGKSLKFEISCKEVAVGGAVSEAVRVHRCFRSEIGDENQAKDCGAVRSFAVNDWQKTCPSGDESCLKGMDLAAGPAGGPALNRADSGNFTLNQRLGTVFHEVGHLLGLNDEYEMTPMPLGLLGPKESFMNNSHDPNSRPMPYHFARIVEPLSCVEE